MASGPTHYRAAEQLLTRAADDETPAATYFLRRALAHAQLAQAAATVDVGLKYDGSIRNDDEWREVTK